MLDIVELLTLRGFDPTIPTKMVRHADSRRDMDKLYQEGWLELYQSLQIKPVFHKVQQIVAFVGERGTRSRFVGVYKVLGHRSATEVKLPSPQLFPVEDLEELIFYDLAKLEGYEDLEERVVIDWGLNTVSWHQYLREKPVVELLAPGGEAIPVFSDYLQFILTHEELVTIVENPDAHRDWKSRLSAVAGVYLIQATTTGKQYVGSAHGADGVWSRWSDYARNGHGGNKLLEELVREDSEYPSAFQFSLLQVLPKSMTRADVIGWEQVFKNKLGSRATGLNLN